MSHVTDVLHELAYDAHVGITGWARLNCPFCIDRRGNDDTNQSMGFRPDNGFYVCHRCDARGKADPLDASAIAPVAKKVVVEEFPLPEEFVPFELDHIDPESPASLFFDKFNNYLNFRRVAVANRLAIGLGYCITGNYKDRIVVPLKRKGMVTGWVGRTIQLYNRLRYLNPPDMPRREILFNEDAIYEETDTPLLICEGVFSAMPHWPNGVAGLGKPTDEHLELYAQSSRPLVVCLDADAYEMGKWFCTRLHLEGKTAAWIKFKPRTDPGDYDATFLLKLARMALARQEQM